MELASSVVYSNLLGFNARVIMPNLTQPFVMTAPEFGGTYGHKIALKSQLAVQPQYMRKGYSTVKLMEEIGMLRAGVSPSKWTGEAVEMLETSMRHSMPAKLVRKYSRMAMWLYEKSDHHNRLVTWKMSQYISDDMFRGFAKLKQKQALTRNEAAAIKGIRNIDPAYRTLLRKAASEGNEKEFRSLMGRYLVGKTQFHYNRAAMSEYGRFMGHMFSMFTKWPMSISGHMGDLVLDRGMSAGMRQIGAKYLGPLVMLGLLDKFALPDPSESDTMKLLVGRGGLAGWTPAQAGIGFMTGQFTTPPMVDAAVRTIGLAGALASVKDSENDKFMNWVSQGFQYWTPGQSFLRFIFDDIPTMTTGTNPKYIGK